MKDKEPETFNINLDAIEFLGSEVVTPEQISGSTLDFVHQVNIVHKMDLDKSKLIAIASIETSSKDEPGLKGSVKSSFIFSIDSLQEKIEKNDESGTSKLPDNLLRAINSIVLSTARGIMFSTFRGTILHKAILPLVQELERH